MFYRSKVILFFYWPIRTGWVSNFTAEFCRSGSLKWPPVKILEYALRISLRGAFELTSVTICWSIAEINSWTFEREIPPLTQPNLRIWGFSPHARYEMFWWDCEKIDSYLKLYWLEFIVSILHGGSAFAVCPRNLKIKIEIKTRNLINLLVRSHRNC